MKNINSLLPRHYDVETPLEGIKEGSGTFKEILDGVYAGTIYPLTNKRGDIVGIGVDTGKVGAEDSIELEKFKIKYGCYQAMRFFEKAFELCYEKKVAIKNVIEDDYTVKVETEDGEILTIFGSDRAESRRAAVPDCLPDHLDIPSENLQGPGNTERNIKRYLKEKYHRYLAGGVDRQFDAEMKCDESGNPYWEVTNIKWGRQVD